MQLDLTASYNGSPNKLITMPLLWRYLLSHYLKVFSLAVSSFIAILLVSRLTEIAQLATMGAESASLALFVLYQIPIILPIAIPLSALLSAMLLFQSLSHTHELTAFRTAGMSLARLLLPVLSASALLAYANFLITSELATASHRMTRQMVNELTSINPLVLLQKAKSAHLKGAYIQMDPVKSAESAQDLLIALPNASNDRLTLLMAKNLKIQENQLLAQKVSILGSTPSKEGGFDHLILENEAETSSPAPAFAKLLRKGGMRLVADHLSWRHLRVRIADAREEIGRSTERNVIAANSKILAKSYSEIVRRLCLGLAPLTFTLLGCAFGMEVGRGRSKRGIIIVLLLAALALISFFAAKAFDFIIPVALVGFLAPHVVIIGASLLSLARVNKGIET